MSRKLTIEQMHAIAKDRGGKCLSKKYVGNKTKLLWECSEGHRFWTMPTSVKNNQVWCHKCFRKRQKNSIEQLQEIAKEHGGKCLSKKYINNRTKVEWECSEGHRWWTRPSTVKDRGRWCPDCSGNVKLTLGKMQAIAKECGGKCLSKKYVNSKTKLEWECASGHRWKAILGNVRRGSWCPTCANRKSGEYHKLTIQDMQKIAKSRGGKCLSKKYININTKLKWKCSKGHQWKMLPAKAKQRGQWCPECTGNVKLTLGKMQAIAKERGGKCLSKKCVDARTHLEWECRYGHRWWTTPGAIRFGSWCPECDTGISERICRAYFKQLFGKPFPKSRPRWLKNNFGHQMELDGYCRDLKIAFEHQGEQHYTTTTRFITSEDALLKRKKDDDEKILLCKKNGIRLIAIPSLFSRTKLEDLQCFIFEECKRLQIRRPAGMLDKKINLKSAWISNIAKQELEALQTIAKERGGRCLSKMYINQNTKLEWECAEGHRWKAVATSVKSQGTWCAKCSGVMKMSIEEMQAIAKSRGGKCLSKRYVNAVTKIQWECEQGHRWKAVAASVKNLETWCPDCSGNVKLTLGQMQETAKKHKGKCLSKKYVNGTTKLEWECSMGHRWKASAMKVIHRNQWCPDCAGNIRSTIEQMQAIAKDRGGKCLSKKYVNSKTKLEWQCSEGHKWKAVPYSVSSQGTWCPKCASVKKSESQRLTIEEMRSIAEKRGGKCLSKKYININTKLKWKCSKGHQWKMLPIKAKHRGQWCPKCKKK
jgi:hypothetical protein